MQKGLGKVWNKIRELGKRVLGRLSPEDSRRFWRELFTDENHFEDMKGYDEWIKQCRDNKHNLHNIRRITPSSNQKKIRELEELIGYWDKKEAEAVEIKKWRQMQHEQRKGK